MADTGTFKCPNCGKSIEVKVDSLKPGKSIKCSHCSQSYKITGKDVAELLRNFKRDIGKQFSKKISIKL